MTVPTFFGSCCGVTLKQYKNKPESARQKWACVACRTAKCKDDRRGDNTATNEAVDMKSVLLSMNKKLDSLLPFKTWWNIWKKSVKLMSDKYDELLERLGANANKTKKIEKWFDTLEQKNHCCTEETQSLRLELNDLEWRNRLLNLKFYGTATSENENLIDKVNSLAGLLEVSELSESDIMAVHRLPAKFGKTPGVIVKYAKQAVRDEWLANRQKLRQANGHTFIQENMDTYIRNLLRGTKDWAKLKGYRYPWHRKGKIF